MPKILDRRLSWITPFFSGLPLCMIVPVLTYVLSMVVGIIYVMIMRSSWRNSFFFCENFKKQAKISKVV